MGNSHQGSLISGCVQAYLLSLILYDGYGIFISEADAGFFGILPVVYHTGGPVVIVAVHRLVGARAGRAAVDVALCLLYLAGSQMINGGGFHRDDLIISVILSVAAFGLCRYGAQRSSGIAIFEGTAVVLLFAMVVVQIRFDLRISVIPAGAAVVLGLAEVMRMSFADSAGRERKFLLLVNGAVYCLGAFVAAIVIFSGPYIVDGLIWFGDAVVRVIREGFAFFSRGLIFASGFFGKGGQESSVQIPSAQMDGRADWNGWILFGVGCLFLAFLVLCAAALVIHMVKGKRSAEDKIVFSLRRRRALQTRAENRKRKGRRRSARSLSLKYFFKKAENPRIFMYKLGRILRNTDARILPGESPRQVFEKLIALETMPEEYGERLRDMADLVDRYYYAQDRGAGYQQAEGEALLKRIKKDRKRNGKREPR